MKTQDKPEPLPLLRLTEEIRIQNKRKTESIFSIWQPEFWQIEKETAKIELNTDAVNRYREKFISAMPNRLKKKMSIFRRHCPDEIVFFLQLLQTLYQNAGGLDPRQNKSPLRKFVELKNIEIIDRQEKISEILTPRRIPRGISYYLSIAGLWKVEAISLFPSKQDSLVRILLDNFFYFFREREMESAKNHSYLCLLGQRLRIFPLPGKNVLEVCQYLEYLNNEKEDDADVGF